MTETATFDFASGEISTGTELDPDLSTPADLFAPLATSEADTPPTIVSEEDIPGRFELLEIPDGRGGSNELVLNLGAATHLTGVDTRAAMGIGGGVGATGKPVRVRLLNFFGSFVGDRLESNRVFIGKGGNQLSKGNVGVFEPKVSEDVDALGRPGAWTSFGGYYEINPLVDGIRELNGRTSAPERVGKLDAWLKGHGVDADLSINPSVTLDAVGTIADVRDEKDGSIAAFGGGLLFELYGRDGVKLKLGNLSLQLGTAGGVAVSAGLTVHDENADENVAPLNYGDRASAAADLRNLCERGGAAALLSQGSNQYVLNEGRVLNHGYRPMADLWDVVRLLNEIVDPATGGSVLTLDTLSLDESLSLADVVESVDRALDRELLSADDLANATGFDFGNRSVTDANRALFGPPDAGEDTGGGAGSGAGDGDEGFRPTVLPRNLEYREDGTIVDRNPRGHNDVYDAGGLTLIGREDIAPGERALRFLDDTGRDLLNEVVRPGLANTFGVAERILEDVEADNAEAGARVREVARDIVEELADVPGSLVEGAKDAAKLLRDIVLDPKTFPFRD